MTFAGKSNIKPEECIEYLLILQQLTFFKKTKHKTNTGVHAVKYWGKGQ